MCFLACNSVFLLNATVKWVTILLCTQVAIISNRGLHTSYHDRLFCRYSESCIGRFWDSGPNNINECLQVELKADILVPGFSSRKLGQIPCEDIMVRFPIPECWIYLFRVEKHFRYGSVKSTHRRYVHRCSSKSH